MLSIVLESRLAAFAVICLYTLISPAHCYEVTDSVATELTFERDIRPILKVHCFQCHGEGGVIESSLDVRLRRTIFSGGDSGAAIQPGDPNNSLLLQRVTQGEMPPEDKHLSVEEIAKLRTWIAQGAKTLRS